MKFPLPAGSTLEEFQLVVSQEADCCADSSKDNALTLTTPDGGGGSYLVLEGRWAMDSQSEIDALATLLRWTLEFSRRHNFPPPQ